MRVTTGLFVAALLRRAMRDGGFAAVLRKGAEEAGAVLVIARTPGGAQQFYRPAPQSAYEAGGPQDRRFVRDSAIGDDESIARAIERETRFDPDVWVIEIEIAGDDPGDLLAVMTP
ncbi:MAG: DUF1491 family protein [Phyllobacteriaceae bacterium]|nr:DUF1491 family protein [Phyllobacteriaceae bacterium]